jgi:hypothetical protein
MRAPCVGIDRAWLGSQAFQFASAFNANIGAWNTASIATLQEVSAASPARAAHHGRRDALGGSSVRRGPLCAAGPLKRARVCSQMCGHAHARVSPCVGIAVRSKDGLHVCMDINVCICMYIYVCIYKGICVLV